MTFLAKEYISSKSTHICNYMYVKFLINNEPEWELQPSPLTMRRSLCPSVGLYDDDFSSILDFVDQ